MVEEQADFGWEKFVLQNARRWDKVIRNLVRHLIINHENTAEQCTDHDKMLPCED